MIEYFIAAIVILPAFVAAIFCSFSTEKTSGDYYYIDADGDAIFL
jgi:hypothetical protein